MQPNYQQIHKPVIASIVLLIVVYLIRFGLSIHDLLYFRKIMAGSAVSPAAHTFFIKKTQIVYWVSTTAYMVFLLSFLAWFYFAYKRIYLSEPENAPFKPAIVPFSYIIPIFNLYAPYQIMRFIWWGNATSDEEVAEGFKIIKHWWFISILNLVLSRVAITLYNQSTDAKDLTGATYYYLFIYILSIHFLVLTYKLIAGATRQELYR